MEEFSKEDMKYILFLLKTLEKKHANQEQMAEIFNAFRKYKIHDYMAYHKPDPKKYSICLIIRDL